MKSLEELAFASTNLNTLLTHVILAEVEEAARARRFGRELVRINEDLVRTKGRNLVFFTRGILSAGSVSEGSSAWDAAGGTVSYTPTTLSVSKFAVATRITQEAIDGSNLDLIRDNIREAGIALADKEDTEIVHTLVGEKSTLRVQAITAVDGGTTSLGFAPVTWIDVLTGNNTITVDYYSGVVVASNTSDPYTVSYYYSGRENYLDALTEGTFAYNDIVRTANVVRGKKWAPDFMLIHPSQMADLLKSAQFVDASKYGAREPLLRGEIGQISGMRVLVTTNVSEGNALVIASKRAAWLAIKRHIDLKRWDNPEKDSIELYFFMEYGCAVTDEDAVCLLVGLGSTTIS